MPSIVHGMSGDIFCFSARAQYRGAGSMQGWVMCGKTQYLSGGKKIVL